MLEYRTDRLDYGQLLNPPEGYRLDRAVAATYSLDLNTLLSIPVALFYAQTLEGELQGERFQLLEAIQRTARTVTVYCQHGHIRVPNRYNRLFAFMEQMIVPVKMGNAFSSFHPKIWVLRYRPEDPRQSLFYRVLVLSRNLTYDRCWDVAVALEGKVAAAAAPRRDNRPLLDFLAYLHGLRPLAEYARFVADLGRVKLEAPGKFDRVRFHPVGISGYTESPVLTAEAREALCMSPFVDDETLLALRECVAGKLWLFSRRAELEKLAPSTVRACQAHCLADRVVEGEREADDGAPVDRQDQDLHAKLFVFQQREQTRWLIGSANATKAARGRNVEFMVELTGADRAITLAVLRDDLLDPRGALKVFEGFDPDLAGKPDLEADLSQKVRRLEFALSTAPLSGSVAPAPNQTNFDLTVSLDLRGVAAPKGLTLAMALITSRDGAAAETRRMRFGELNQSVFANLAETDLSQFVSLSIRDGEETLRHFLLKYEINGLPSSRLDQIVNDIVSNTDQFFAYLRFLLADEFSKSDFHASPGDGKGRSVAGQDGFMGTELPLFESILVAASRDPDKMRAVDGVIQRLRTPNATQSALIPAAFLDFWEVFRPLIPVKKTGVDHGN